MRLRAIAVTAIGFIGLSSVAQADEFRACWVTDVLNEQTFVYETITRCRISGGAVVDYSSDNAVPSTLYAQTGTDITGQCWYYTSAPTSYVIIAQFADGSADI